MSWMPGFLGLVALSKHFEYLPIFVLWDLRNEADLSASYRTRM